MGRKDCCCFVYYIKYIKYIHICVGLSFSQLNTQKYSTTHNKSCPIFLFATNTHRYYASRPISLITFCASGSLLAARVCFVCLVRCKAQQMLAAPPATQRKSKCVCVCAGEFCELRRTIKTEGKTIARAT